MLEKTICSNITKKFYVLYLLNALDWACTVALLSTGLFIEANPIANTFIGNMYLGFLIKCVVPFCVIFSVCRHLRELGLSQLKFADMMVSFGLTVYLAITLDHLVNFIILIIS